MITRRECVDDTIALIKAHREMTDIPISVLASPMVTKKEDLVRFRDAGADRIGVAVDLATRELFEKYRGRSRGAPHKWDRYWEFFREAVEVFGDGRVGSHLIVGMGETEQEMVAAIQKTRDFTGETHLFSFYPEEGSDMEDVSPPSIGQYRRIQLARYIIDNDIAKGSDMAFDASGRLIDFGVSDKTLNELIDSGYPFITSGCAGKDGKTVACNRPFGNSRPGPDVRNYPFLPNADDIVRIREQMSRGGRGQ